MLSSVGRRWFGCAVAIVVVAGCHWDESDELFASSSRTPSVGGGAIGGGVTGGETTGGSSLGGIWGSATGGVAVGGTTSGGTAVGGASSGGASSGGSPTGGVDTSGTGGIAGSTIGGTPNGGVSMGGVTMPNDAGQGGGDMGGIAGEALLGGGTSEGGGWATGGASDGGLSGGIAGAPGGAAGEGGTAAGGGGSGGTDAAGQAGAETGGGGGCSTARVAPCGRIPAFEGTQTVDGDDEDLCSLPLFELDFTSEYLHVDHAGAENDRTELLTARVGWSRTGLHVFLYVTDRTMFAADGGLGDIWNGDGIELFFAPSSSGLSGNTGNDEVRHVIFGAKPRRAAIVSTVDAQASHTELGAQRYETTVVEDGYTIEAQLRWPGTAPEAGDEIAFDLALNSADLAPAGTPDGRDAQAVLYVGSHAQSTCSGEVEPWCDDRTWCTPTLD
ncbi:MAG: hypothetical protein JW751_12605 [Polyangiaceae bacterium]|nr:hypothetical protein [Polyangiaceae bacterium]